MPGASGVVEADLNPLVARERKITVSVANVYSKRYGKTAR